MKVDDRRLRPAGRLGRVPRLSDVVNALERLYPPRTAESWDAVGLACGDPDAEVSRVLFAVDPVDAVASEALDAEAQLIVTHHPLFLRGVHGVAATTPKGRLIHRLIEGGVGLYTAHTNADVAQVGVNEALATALGLIDVRPLVPATGEPLDKLIFFAPEADADRVFDAVAAAGAGHIGAYDRCGWRTSGTGTFRPLAGANPTIGAVGDIEEVAEARVESVVPRRLRAQVIEAFRAAHPYEEPAFDVVELADLPTDTGLGRIGMLPDPMPLDRFTEHVAGSLPATAVGVRSTGDPTTMVSTVAVCGGSGDSLFDVVRAAGVDAYVTADLRHHPASDAAAHARPALVDVPHWSSEWPWLPVAAQALVDELAKVGTTVETHVSMVLTDPWTRHVPSRPHDEGSFR
jgi:dinuclear metal center YbgI/SA1388 family protein